MDADAPSAPSLSSITSGPTRWEGQPPPRTFRCAAGATINTRRRWSLVLAPGTSRATLELASFPFLRQPQRQLPQPLPRGREYRVGHRRPDQGRAGLADPGGLEV